MFCKYYIPFANIILSVHVKTNQLSLLFKRIKIITLWVNQYWCCLLTHARRVDQSNDFLLGKSRMIGLTVLVLLFTIVVQIPTDLSLLGSIVSHSNKLNIKVVNMQFSCNLKKPRQCKSLDSEGSPPRWMHNYVEQSMLGYSHSYKIFKLLV